MEILIAKNECGFRTFHVGANGAYYVAYNSENPEALLSRLVAAGEVFVPAPNFWGDAFKEEFIATANNFPEAAELVLYHRYMDEEDLETAAWLLLRCDTESRVEFYKSYLAAYEGKEFYEIASNSPDKLVKILANIVRKL